MLLPGSQPMKLHRLSTHTSNIVPPQQNYRCNKGFILVMGVMNKGTGEMFDLGLRTSRPRSHRVLMNLTWDEPEMMLYSLVHSRHYTPSCGSLHFASIN